MKFHGLVSENMLMHLLPENCTLQLHFWYDSLNFEASLTRALLHSVAINSGVATIIAIDWAGPGIVRAGPGIDWAGLEVFGRAARRDGRPISDAYVSNGLNYSHYSIVELT